jgi:hypothetical protein
MERLTVGMFDVLMKGHARRHATAWVPLALTEREKQDMQSSRRHFVCLCPLTLEQ